MTKKTVYLRDGNKDFLTVFTITHYYSAYIRVRSIIAGCRLKKMRAKMIIKLICEKILIMKILALLKIIT